MSDVMLHGVLCMPTTMWHGDALDQAQRQSFYLRASKRIYDDEARIAALEAENARLKEQAEKLAGALDDMLDLYGSDRDTDDAARQALADYRSGK